MTSLLNFAARPGFTHPDAACRGTDPNLWFPPRTGTVDVAKAKTICAGCPARSPCLEYALEHREKQGVWGGLSEKQRRLLRARRHRTRTLIQQIAEES